MDRGRAGAPSLSVDAARAALFDRLAPLAETEAVPLSEATGRALAADAIAPVPLPPFDQAAMDGYAVATAALTGDGPWSLPLDGEGGARWTAAGAPMPPGRDALAMRRRPAQDVLALAKRPRPGDNVRLRGDDLPQGARILSAGAEIGSREIAALAAVGCAGPRVRRRLRVALLDLGEGVRDPGAALGAGELWNADLWMLRAALARPWVATTDLGAAANDHGALAQTLARAGDAADLILSVGGRAGGAGRLAAAAAAAGGAVAPLPLAMKPGKPLGMGRVGAAALVALPGGPAAAFTVWTVLVGPAARRAAGFARAGPDLWAAIAGFALDRRPGRREYRPVRVISRAAGRPPVVAPLTPRFAAGVAALAAADGFAVFPEDATRIAPGAPLDFLPLGPERR